MEKKSKTKVKTGTLPKVVKSKEANNATTFVAGNSKTFLLDFPHYIAVAPNSTTADCNYSFKPTVWQSTHPVAAFVSDTIQPTDSMLSLVKQKDLFVQELLKTKNFYKKNKPSITRHLATTNQNENIQSRYVYRFACILETDPDEYYSGAYDWYYTGGSLNLLSLEDKDWLLHTYENRLKISEIKEVDNRIEISKSTQAHSILCDKLATNQTIYEIRSGKKFNSNVVVRQKNCVSIIDLSENEILCEVQSKIPFVSADLERKTNKLITVDVKQNVQVFDKSYASPITEGNITKSSNTIDNWSCVRSCSISNLFSYSDRKYLSLYDTRVPISLKSYCTNFNLTNLLDECEMISCIEHSNSSNSNLLYVATTHKMFAIDVRYDKAKKYVEMVRWHHQLKTQPTMISVANNQYEDGELIVVSGTKTADVQLFETTIEYDKIISPYLPYKPLDMWDSLRLTKSKGKCIDPLSRVSEHIKLSNSGIKLYKKNKNYHLLRQNCDGTIFAQQLLRKPCDTSALDKNAVNRVEEWDEQLKANFIASDENKIQLTDIADFHSLANLLKNNLSKNYDTIDVDIEPTRKRNPRWKQSVKKLQTFKDTLAVDILSIWNVDDENNDLNKVVDPTVNVSRWLEQANSEPIDKSQLMKDFTSMQIEEELVKQIQNIPKKPNIKRRTFVPGF